MTPSSRSDAAWREARRLLHRHRGPLIGALALVAVNRLAALALPTASKYVVDEVIGRQRTGLLWPIALLVCPAVAIEVAAAFGASQVAGVSGLRAIAALRQELEARVAASPLPVLETDTGGTLASRIMTDPEHIRYLVGNGSVQIVASLLSAGLALGILFWLDTPLTLGVLLILALAGFAVSRSFRSIAQALEGVLRQQSELTGGLGQLFGGIRVVKAYLAERRESHRFARESHRLVRTSVRALREISILNAGGALASGMLGVLLLVAGGRAVAAGAMTVGSYVMYVWLTGYLLGPVFHVAASAGELGKAVAALKRIAELRERATEAEEDCGRRRVRSLTGSVDFESVGYAYEPGRPALRDVTLHAPAGSTTAVVGSNGSGKSTLCRLILAFDRPSSGRILIDGRDLATLERRSYRSNLGVVLQDDCLFDGTIADNIRYGRSQASWAEVDRAARLAHCDEFVSRMPDGYLTRVGDRGVRLSAGQRQRVAIARAFLVDPRILILDEATSHLDAESEGMIVDALRDLRRGRTTFIIAHRLSTIRGADQIIVLERGSVVECRLREAGDPLAEAITWVARTHPPGIAMDVAHRLGGNGHEH